LRNWVYECQAEIDHVLDSIGYNPNPIRIDFPLEFSTNGRTIISYSSFNNGIVTKDKTGKLKYIMPSSNHASVYPSPSPWGRAVKDTLEKHGLLVDWIPSSIHLNSGIHCQVKVTNRK
jgi:hypothetical protein